MKMRFATATIALVSIPALSQSARTGVSSPEPVIINAQPDETVTVKVTPAKPSAAIPETTRPVARHEGTTTSTGSMPRHEGTRTTRATGSGEVFGAYVPYAGGASTAGAKTAADPDASIVTSVEEHAGEVREGTLLRARIKQSLSTVTTAPGTRFTAELTEPVVKDGRIVLPEGAVIEGRVTEVHGGRRISGAAALHLEPRTVTLPDGTHYVIHAQLIDTDQTSHTSVDREGTLLRRDHPRETLAAVGLSTGGAAAAGAVVGGGVGAAVGAGIGAGAGAILWLKQDRQAVLPGESLLVFSLTEAMPVMPVGNNPVSRLDTNGAGARTRLPSNPGGSIVE